MLRQLKSVPGTRLHASVAGGRKSMSFYMGQAFSLVAEPQDRLSHVLVNEPFETVPDFYYPPPAPRDFTTRDGRLTTSSAEARVQLADLSVIRLGSMLGELPARAQTDFDFAMRIAQAVVVPPEEVRLVWDKTTESGQVEMLGECIELSQQKFAVLALHAIARVEGAGTTDAGDGQEHGAFLLEDLPARLITQVCGDNVSGTKFGHVLSKMRTDIAAKVGKAADWLSIEVVGAKRKGEERPRLLRLPASHLRLVNLPPEWHRGLLAALRRPPGGPRATT